MRPIHAAAAVALSYAVSAAAQVHQVAYELEGDIFGGAGAGPIDHSVAASSTRVIVATNNRVKIFSTAGGPALDDWAIDDPDFPFKKVSTAGFFPFFDPRVEYDPIHDRFWLVYPEAGSAPAPDSDSYLHVAVSKSNEPHLFDSDNWHFFTGDGANPAFNLQHDDIPLALRFIGTLDHPTINVTEDHLFLVAADPHAGEDVQDKIVAFPLSHAGGSMLSGARPSEGDLRILALNNPAFVDPEDDGLLHYAVQSPHEIVDDVQLFLCTPEPALPGSGPTEYNGVQDAVRLGGAWFDALGELQEKWVDLPMPSDSFFYFNGGVAGNWPASPDSSWEINTRVSTFDSGVLARTVNNELRLFASQHVLFADVDGPPPHTPVDRHELRYYVIDPDLASFFTSWTPSIEVAGTAPAGSGEETYHGNISVNALGAAYITFTRSGPAQWPSLYYSKLTTDYTSVIFTNQIEQGPPQRFLTSGVPVTTLSADYTDLQPDPDGCGFWSLAALVAPKGGTPLPPESNFRNIWLTEIPVDCNQAEMNGDGTVDEFDLALYLDHYARGAPQADMNGDKSVDLTDYVIYSDEYAKR